MYFKDFPKFIYDFKYSNSNVTKTSVVKDITRNIRFRKEILANITLYDEYDIVDGETPEIIAEKVYGNPEYHWIIMLVNEKYDYSTDFPLEEYALVKVIQDKYGNNANAVKHYVNAAGFVVNSNSPGAVPVTNEQWEREQNEKKRRIKLISKQLIGTILKNYKDLM